MVAHLDKLGLAENTILIFMTDNGTAAGVARGRQQADKWNGFNAGMRGQKGSQYEGGHRVPCFVRWPAGKVGGGRDIQELSAHIDLLPTLIDVCGLKKPSGAALDGVSRKPLWLGEKSASADRTLFVNSQRVEKPIKWKKCAVMTERWRLVDGKELYDIAADPGQQDDIAARHADVVAALRKDYEAWWSSISDRFDEYSRIVVGAEQQNPTTLTCHDWHAAISQVPWNHGHIRSGLVANGYWAIDVAKGGAIPGHSAPLAAWCFRRAARQNRATESRRKRNQHADRRRR